VAGEGKGAAFRRWLDDNAVQLILFGIAFGGSFDHWVHLAARNGQPGVLACIAAVCVDLGVYRMAKERQRDALIGRHHRGLCSMPTLFLFGLIVLTLAGNVAAAERTGWGITVALIPGAVLLMAIALGERRAAEDGRRAAAERQRQADEAAERERQAEADRQRAERQADRQRRLVELTTTTGLSVSQPSGNVTPAALPAGTGEASASGVQVMRAYWDREVSAGRIPTGADLIRAAGLSPASSLGRQMAARWRAELEERELDGAAR